MQNTIRILFFAAVGLSAVFSYRGQVIATIVSFVCAFGLWLAYVLQYSGNRGRLPSTAQSGLVSFLVGVFFVAAGIWAGVRFLWSVPTIVGGILISVVFVLFPIFCGAAIIRRELRLRRR